MIRSVVKDAAAGIATWTGINRFARTALHRQLPFVVAYHRVVERLNSQLALPAMEVSTTTLEKHIDWIARNFEIISLDDWPKRVRTKPLAAVTFDDGYSDVFYHGFPLLKRKGIPATIFVLTDLVGTKTAPVHERLYAILTKNHFIANPFAETQSVLRSFPQDRVLELIDHMGDQWGRIQDALQPLTWEMLAAMRDAGMTIGSHSATHAFLTNENAMRIREEASSSRAALKRMLNVTARCFAYPGGAFNANVLDAVESAGYTLGFTICRHRDSRRPLLTIPRSCLWERSCLDRSGRFSASILGAHASGMLGGAYCGNIH